MWTPVLAVVVVLSVLIPGAPTRAVGTTSDAHQPAIAHFQPQQVALAATEGEVFVLGYETCNAVSSCSGPELWAGKGSSFTERVVPPGTSQDYLSQLVFANALDGYVLNRLPSVYATTNGGMSWTAPSLPSHTVVISMAASDDWFYAVVAHCVVKGEAATCDDYRLARSVAGSPVWTSVPIPYTSDFSGSATTYLGVTAWGREVTVSVLGPGEGETLLRSEGGAAPLRVAGRSAWSGANGACILTATSYLSIWELCPGGMREVWLYSNDGGGHFRRFWWPFQTGGTAFDPVSGDVAFRYTGPVAAPQPSELELTTNGGGGFTPVAYLPHAGVMAFLTIRHGYMIGSTTAGASNRGLIQTFDGGHTWHKVVFRRAGGS